MSRKRKAEIEKRFEKLSRELKKDWEATFPDFGKKHAPCPFCGSFRSNHERGRGMKLCVTPKSEGLK